MINKLARKCAPVPTARPIERSIVLFVIVSLSTPLISSGNVEPYGSPPTIAWRYPKEPSLKGVTVGTTLEEVLNILGEPSDKQITWPAAAESRPSQTLEYPGLLIEVFMPKGRSSFEVWSFLVTGKQWTVDPGIKIGMSEQKVIKLLGQPSESHNPRSDNHVSWRFKPDHLLRIICSDQNVIEILITKLHAASD